MSATSLNSLAELAQLSEDEADEFFAACDPEALVVLVGDAGDAELRRLAALHHLRSAAVRRILARLPEFAIADRLAAVKGVVHFEVTVPKGAPEIHGLRFDGGVEVVDAEEHPADVVLRTDVLTFLRLVSGSTNAALLVLGGSLSVEGDAQLALTVGGVFRVPGRPGVAVDPGEVDPGAVARLLKHTTDDHLRAVMAGGLRPVVLSQVFTRFPEFLDTERAADTTLTIGFHITGEGDAGPDSYVVRIIDGRCDVEEDPTEAGERDATLSLSGARFLKLVTGHLNPVTAVMKGTIKVRGDVKSALLLHKLMQIPES